jgi:polysaccharide pyruvyl transferase WcaK-like protein
MIRFFSTAKPQPQLEQTLMDQWKAQRELEPALSHVMILPSDPGTLVGSRGDEAMITAVLEHYRSVNPTTRFTVLTPPGPGSIAAPRYDLEPYSIWNGDRFAAFSAALARMRPDQLVIFGADVMDGAYSADFSAERFAMADLAARAGVRTLVTGFSFNRSASPSLRRVIDLVHSDVTFKIRDPHSSRQWHRFTNRRAELVADVAFLLDPAKPSDLPKQTLDWIGTQKSQGRRVFGFNVHPTLFDRNDGNTRSHLDYISFCLKETSNTDGVSWILLPHDYRDGVGDVSVLASIHDKVASESIHFMAEQVSAPVIKAIAGKLDGVITGRMHLAIAALGMGTPASCFDYQDKFRGLFRLFDIPNHHLADIDVLCERNRLVPFIRQFISSTPKLRTRVARKAQEVIALANRNFTFPG